MAIRKKRKITSLVFGHLEKIGAKVFDEYSNVITDLIGGHQGIYALYKKDRLYYVGLATNLKGRIKAHNEDKHKGKWTHFSLYVIRKASHIRELESLVLRISYPKGNTIKGKLSYSTDLRPLLKKRLKAEWERKFIDFIGGKKADKAFTKDKRTRTANGKNRPLSDLFTNGKMIYATYQGKEFKAWVFRNGRIKFGGSIFNSPSLAGIAVTKRKTINGWKFWKYINKNNELVYIDELRKKNTL